MNTFLIILWVSLTSLLVIALGASPLGLAFAFTISILSAFTVIAGKIDAGEI
jgi:hypothetical protein